MTLPKSFREEALVAASANLGIPVTWMSSRQRTRVDSPRTVTLSSAQPVTTRPRFSSRQNDGASHNTMSIGSLNANGPSPVRATKPVDVT